MTRYQILALWFSFLALQLVAFVNSYVVDLKGGTIDAARFQTAAANWAIDGRWEFAVNSEFFVQYLGLLFRLFGPSEFVATQFGIVALLAAVFLCIKMAREIGVHMPALAILALALWPSMALRVTTTLREPYMVLFVTLSLYGLLFFSKSGRWRYAGIALLGICLGALFHKALAVLAPFTLMLLFLSALRQHRGFFKSSSGLVLIGLTVIALIGFAGSGTSVKGLKPLQALLLWDTETITRVIDYKSGRDFRTTYDAGLNFSGALPFMLSLIKSFIYYMFMPFPWLWRTPLDLLAGIEATFRLGGLILMLRFSVLGRGLPSALRPVSIATLILLVIWAVGTANYGTASRHHLTTNWVFILIYIACFSKLSLPASTRGLAGAIRQN